MIPWWREFRRWHWAAHAVVLIIALILALLDTEDTFLLSLALVNALLCFDCWIIAINDTRRKKTFDMIIAWFIASLGAIGVVLLFVAWLYRLFGGCAVGSDADLRAFFNCQLPRCLLVPGGLSFVNRSTSVLGQ